MNDQVKAALDVLISAMVEAKKLEAQARGEYVAEYICSAELAHDACRRPRSRGPLD